MKKLLPLFFVLLVFGCSKKDDPEPKNELVGTKWQTRDWAGEVVYGGEWYQVIHFKTNSDFEIYSTKNGKVQEYDHEGTYTLKGKTVKLKYTDKDEEVLAEFLIVNSGTMKRVPERELYGTYVKQQ